MTDAARAKVEADPSRAIERMFSKMDAEDKEAFNFCVKAGRGHTTEEHPICVEHNREVVFCGSCLANKIAERTAALQEQNANMKRYIQAHGYGHTDWPERTGCEKPGPQCFGRCIARCEDVDNLHVTVFLLREQTAELRELLKIAHRLNYAVHMLPGKDDAWLLHLETEADCAVCAFLADPKPVTP